MTVTKSDRNTHAPHLSDSDPARQAVPADDIPDDENLVDEPLADKSNVSAPMHDTADPANNSRRVPGVDPDQLDTMRDESRQELDLSTGRLRDADLTQGRNVVDAEFDDRGPATHTHPDKEK
ncbi:hypothetical protein ACUNV4_19080 [Granulosicoccus sp. 3-233]|uniref:hypothetical protein n=1 Tax=Granulosicoccus sp. 3-233 TaxID=3417969 RepID=UPI003D353C3B